MGSERGNSTLHGGRYGDPVLGFDTPELSESGGPDGAPIERPLPVDC